MHRGVAKIGGIVFLLFISISSWSQSRLGQWNEHLPFSNGTKVVQAGNVIYCATRSGLFEYDTESFLIKEWSKVNGLSGVNIATMEYSTEHRVLIIAYSNSNIDLLINSH
ncbi:MAG: hypothetical protein J7L96_04550 [Bacteroidales bacterium]|nr:hypothetical protein [Bacteroidales bacterium]